MFYIPIRITFFIVLACGIFIFRNKVWKNKSKLLIKIGLVLLILVCIFIWILPIENIFLRFETPVESFYYSFSNKEILKIIRYENIAVILYGKNNSNYGLCFIQRDQKGWKVDTPNMSLIKTQSWDKAFIQTKKLECNTFISIIEYIYNGSIPNINSLSDTNDSVFLNFELDFNYGRMIFYYTFTDISSPEYFLIINDEKISIN